MAGQERLYQGLLDMLNMPDVRQQQLVLLGGEHRRSFNHF